MVGRGPGRLVSELMGEVRALDADMKAFKLLDRELYDGYAQMRTIVSSGAGRRNGPRRRRRRVLRRFGNEAARFRVGRGRVSVCRPWIRRKPIPSPRPISFCTKRLIMAESAEKIAGQQASDLTNSVKNQTAWVEGFTVVRG